MATLEERLTLAMQRIGTECKNINANIGTLSSLGTTAKTSLVAALNEVNTALTSLTSTVGTNTTDISGLKTKVSALETAVEELEGVLESQTNINDSLVGENTTWSSSKISSELTSVKQDTKDEILGGAGAAFDTLQELATLIETNASAIDALEALAAGHVKYDSAQELTDNQKTQARTNIGAASASDLTSVTSRVTTVEGKVTTLEGKMSTAEGEIDTLQSEMDAVEKVASDNTDAIDALEAAVGDTNVDLVAKFESALNA